METSSIIINIALFSIVIVPIIILVIYTTSGEKKIKKKFSALCSTQGVVLTDFDAHGNAILGIDIPRHTLAISNRKSLEIDFQLIDISSLTDCRVKTIKHSKSTYDWVGLELINKDTKKEIPFYDEMDEDNPATDSQISLQQAIKWEKLIKPLLRAS